MLAPHETPGGMSVVVMLVRNSGAGIDSIRVAKPDKIEFQMNIKNWSSLSKNPVSKQDGSYHAHVDSLMIMYSQKF
jgi:hypothetical protein